MGLLYGDAANVTILPVSQVATRSNNNRTHVHEEMRIRDKSRRRDNAFSKTLRLVLALERVRTREWVRILWRFLECLLGW